MATILAQAGLGEIGSTIFEHHMPADCRKGILVRAPLLGIKIDHYLPGYYRTMIQVIVRDVRHGAGATKAQQVLDLLTIQKPTSYNDPADATNQALQINQMLPETLPIVYPRSVGNGYEFSINLDASYVML